MADPRVQDLPILFHHAVTIDESKLQFMSTYGKKVGAYWVCFCPDGELIRLLVAPSGIHSTFIHGKARDDMRRRYGLTHGMTVDFFYLGGERFLVVIEGWNGRIYPNLTEHVVVDLDTDDETDDEEEV
ncbi:hypothetical protein RIF29_04662 [Crotalaria pallida]|uniref:Uncharacterized protein n=1 Tax=Crotalaria pallida TaxID=3830 RepID=A0AAN9P9Y4_CROPI